MGTWRRSVQPAPLLLCGRGPPGRPGAGGARNPRRNHKLPGVYPLGGRPEQAELGVPVGCARHD